MFSVFGIIKVFYGYVKLELIILFLWVLAIYFSNRDNFSDINKTKYKGKKYMFNKLLIKQNKKKTYWACNFKVKNKTEKAKCLNRI